MKAVDQAPPSVRVPVPITPQRALHVTAVRQTVPGRPRRAWSLLLRPEFERK